MTKSRSQKERRKEAWEAAASGAADAQPETAAAGSTHGRGDRKHAVAGTTAPKAGTGKAAAAGAGRVRLQRYLSLAGLASRREAERWIDEGTVRVNGQLATLGVTVDPEADRVTVGGKLVRGMADKIYLALNKPREVICTREDEKGRRTVMEFLPPKMGLVVPVGRLDYHSTGLLLLTNDGDLANRLTRPSSEVPKVYRVKAAHALAPEEAERFRNGSIVLDGRKTRPALLRSVTDRSGFWYEVVLTEGRNRQVRRMFDALGNRVQKLSRVAIGPVGLGSLELGQVRTLTEVEVEKLKKAAGLASRFSASRSGRKAGWAVPKSRRVLPGRKSRSQPAAKPRNPTRGVRNRKDK